MPWLVYENVYFDSSGIMDQLVGYYGPERVAYILGEIGYDRILFGSDYPTAEIEDQLAALQLVVPEARHADVLGGNAARLGAAFGWWI